MSDMTDEDVMALADDCILAAKCMEDTGAFPTGQAVLRDASRALLDARAELAQARADAKAAVAVPVAWKYRWKIDGEYVGWRYSDASNAHPSLDGYEEQPLYSATEDAIANARVEGLREALKLAGDYLEACKVNGLPDLGDASRMPFLGDVIATVDAALAQPSTGGGE